MTGYRVLTVAIVAVVASAQPSAYETDVHYGLSYWLARQAGFTDEQSREFARGNENADGGYLDAKHAIAVGVCLQGDETASRVVRRYHFRSQRPVPLPPGLRPVSPDTGYAKADVVAQIQASGVELMDHINEFGLAVHGWQDSFSHQGVSSTLALCSDQLIWAHSAARGGVLNPWTAHNADLTHKYPEDCLEAARTSYGHITAFASRHLGALRTAPKRWGDLVGPVHQFCVADTKTGKAHWLRENGVPHPEGIVKSTNLPNGAGDFSEVADLDLSAKRYSPVSMTNEVDPLVGIVYGKIVKEVPPAVRNGVDAFLRRWISGPPESMKDLASVYFDDKAIAEGGAERLLKWWRLRDRGLAASHAVNEGGVPESPQALVTLPEDRWREAFVRPARYLEQVVLLVAAPKEVGPDVSGNAYVAVAVLKHAPNDVLMLTVVPRGEGIRIANWTSLTLH